MVRAASEESWLRRLRKKVSSPIISAPTCLHSLAKPRRIHRPWLHSSRGLQRQERAGGLLDIRILA
jgi:hypothetical protein